MKKIFFVLGSFTIVSFVFILLMSSRYKKTDALHVPVPAPKGFAVMELFTSQGCSSCPPADKLLGKYAQKNDERIIPIAFHVDYWNRLGWKDPFSNPEYTRRQENYSGLFLNASVYTPQLIINGQKEMVGSDETKIEKSIAAALAEGSAVSITIKNITAADNAITIQYSLEGSIAETSVRAVLIQNKVATKIKAGENGGVLLTNYNVVRDLISSDAAAEGNCVLHIPENIPAKDFSVVLFTQNTGTGKITGAIKKPLP